MSMNEASSNIEKSTHERFFRITQGAYIYGFVGHGMLAAMFYFLQVPEMVYFNVFISIPFFVTAFVINKRGKHNLAFTLAFIELLLHQCLGAYYLGWGFGFQYILIYLAGLTFFNIYWSNRTRYILLTLVVLSILGLYFFIKDHQVYILSETIRQIFHTSNSAGALISLALLINYYVQAAIKAEDKLESRNKFIQKTFGRYLSDDIVTSILDTPEGLVLGGEKRKVTILMSDLRGFTKISEQLPPEIVLSMLNIYLKAMTEIIIKYNGTIDEFIGDAILVIFGAPFSNEDDACRAVACALEMQRAMDEVNKHNVQKGFPEIEMGIGINTGEVVVGNIGSDKRSKYGVVGSNVNLTSRIESYTIGGQILVAETTYNECKEILRSDDKMNVMPKGVKEPINIYSIVGLEGEYNIHLGEKKSIEMQSVNNPIDMKFAIVEGKDAGTKSYEGKVLRHSEKFMDVQTDISLERFSNLKISLSNSIDEKVDNEIYAKVIECVSDEPNTFRINVTSASKLNIKNGDFRTLK